MRKPRVNDCQAIDMASVCCQGALQKIANFLFHRQAMPCCAHSQAGFEGFVQMTDLQKAYA
jgi:hypothetical protein